MQQPFSSLVACAALACPAVQSTTLAQAAGEPSPGTPSPTARPGARSSSTARGPSRCSSHGTRPRRRCSPGTSWSRPRASTAWCRRRSCSTTSASCRWGQVGASDKWAVRYRQEIDGVPVVAGSLSVLLDRTGQPLSLQTTALPDADALEEGGVLSVAAARRRALALFEARKGVTADHVGQPRLVVDQVVVPGRRVPALAFELELLSTPELGGAEGERLRIDARTGGLTSAEPAVYHFDVTGTVSTYATPGSGARPRQQSARGRARAGRVRHLRPGRAADRRRRPLSLPGLRYAHERRRPLRGGVGARGERLVRRLQAGARRLQHGRRAARHERAQRPAPGGSSRSSRRRRTPTSRSTSCALGCSRSTRSTTSGTSRPPRSSTRRATVRRAASR